MRRAKYGEPLEWLKAHRDHATSGCLIWPYGKTAKGYGSVRVEGRTRHAHTVMCEMVNGPAPTEAHTDVAHSCGRRDCCNPSHVRYATAKENQRDKIAHGTVIRGEHHTQAKLTAADVLAIRASSQRQASIARQYGVTDRTIAMVRSGQNWGWVGGSPRHPDA